MRDVMGLHRIYIIYNFHSPQISNPWPVEKNFYFKRLYHLQIIKEYEGNFAPFGSTNNMIKHGFDLKIT